MLVGRLTALCKELSDSVINRFPLLIKETITCHDPITHDQTLLQCHHTPSLWMSEVVELVASPSSRLVIKNYISAPTCSQSPLLTTVIKAPPSWMIDSVDCHLICSPVTPDTINPSLCVHLISTISSLLVLCQRQVSINRVNTLLVLLDIYMWYGGGRGWSYITDYGQFSANIGTNKWHRCPKFWDHFYKPNFCQKLNHCLPTAVSSRNLKSAKSMEKRF